MDSNECLRLTVLGSGTCELRAGRGAPAHLVSTGGTNLLMDLGRGALSAMLDTGMEAVDLSAALISHHHPDHIADLVPLLFALNYDPALKSRANVEIMGHPGLERVFDGLDRTFGHWLAPQSNNTIIRWIEPGRSVDIGGVRITAAAASHMETSLAYRLDRGGASLVYLGDSEYFEDLADFCGGAGLLLVNCASTDQRPKPGHMGPAQSGRLAASAGVGALLLSHLYGDVDPEQAKASAAEHFSGPIYTAFDKQSLFITPTNVTPQ